MLQFSFYTVAHFQSQLNSTFEIENRQRNAIKFCVSIDKIEQILVCTHVGDDTVVACRGTELKAFVGRYFRGMLTFHSKSVFSYYTKLVQRFQVGIHFFIELHHQIYCSNPFIYSIYIYMSHNMYICCEQSMQHIKPSLSNIIVGKKGVYQ